MYRPLGSLLLSLPVALVLAAPVAQAQSSSGTQSGRLPGLLDLFRSNSDQDDDEIRQAQVQQPYTGQRRIESESLPPPGLAQPYGGPPQAIAPNSNLPAGAQPGYAQPVQGQPNYGQTNAPSQGGPIGHQFGNQPPAQAVAPVTERPPVALGVPSGSPPAVPPNSVMTLLPPEDQPEQGQPKELPENLKRQLVDFQTKEPAGTIIVDTPNTYLYLVLGGGKALRYGVRVGREGFTWSGTERISRMKEWPDWHPPAEMIERQPYLPRFMAGGNGNPMGARALYLGSTLYRIHGTNQPSTIGQTVSSGCVGMLNEDVEDLFSRVQVGTRVVVWPGNPPSTVANAAPPAPATGLAPPPPAANAAPAATNAPAPVNPPIMSRPMQPAR